MSKVALVVGGGKSLGAFLCKGLAEAGYRVAVADMDADSAKLTASERFVLQNPSVLSQVRCEA